MPASDDCPLLRPAIRAEALEILCRLSPSELWGQVVRPLFSAGGWEAIEETWEDPVGEVVLTTTQHGEPWVVRVRLEDIREQVVPESLLGQIRGAAAIFFARKYVDSRVPLLRYRWILPTSLPEQAKQEIRIRIDDELGDRVSVWDLAALYRELVERGQVRTIAPLQIIHAKHEAEQHRRRGEGVFAAHWLYRAFRLYLQQEPVDIEKARECLDEGLAALGADERRQRHPYRVLRRVLETWSTLLRKCPGLFASPAESLDSLFSDNAVAAALDRIVPGHPRLEWLLQDFDRVYWQLEKLAELYVDTPALLSTLQICRLLLRFGFPPSEPGIKRRLDRIEKDFREQGSIDGECSLCTAAALSCLSLARRKDTADQVAAWLTQESIQQCRYCHMQPLADIKRHEHALHYAAKVLLGLLDHADERAASVLEEFFRSTDKKDIRGFYLDWMRYSNIDRFESYRYILTTFLHHRLMGNSLPPEREDCLKHAVRTLVRTLDEESHDVQKVYLFYPTRTNLPSLTLGLLLGVEEAAKLARHVAGYIRRRADSAGKIRGDFWDSNIDRNIIHLEGYLDYWEALFVLEEHGGRIHRHLPSRIAPSLGRRRPGPASA